MFALMFALWCIVSPVNWTRVHIVDLILLNILETENKSLQIEESRRLIGRTKKHIGL